jgi:hypothetical protein
VICQLKARIVEPAEMAAVRERPGIHHVTAGYHGERGNTTVEKKWKEVISV